MRFVDDADELGSYELKPNYRTLGPRFSKGMPQVAAAVAALDAGHVTAALRDGRPVGITIDGVSHDLGPDDLQIAMQPLEGYQLEREGSHAVALDLTLDDELRRRGLAREIVHAVQNARKGAGLAVEDRIALTLGGDAELLDAAREHETFIAAEALALSVAYDGDGSGEPATIDGRELRIAVAKAWAPVPLALGGEVVCELLLDARLGQRADDLVDGLAVLEQDHRRDRHHPELRGGLLVVVDVELDDAHVVTLGVDLLEQRADHAARSAPGGPEVDQRRRIGLDDVGLEAVVGDLGKAHLRSPWRLVRGGCHPLYKV